jgi:hypothetical protein
MDRTWKQFPDLFQTRTDPFETTLSFKGPLGRSRDPVRHSGKGELWVDPRFARTFKAIKVQDEVATIATLYWQGQDFGGAATSFEKRWSPLIAVKPREGIIPVADEQGTIVAYLFQDLSARVVYNMPDGTLEFDEFEQAREKEIMRRGGTEVGGGDVVDALFAYDGTLIDVSNARDRALESADPIGEIVLLVASFGASVAVSGLRVLARETLRNGIKALVKKLAARRLARRMARIPKDVVGKARALVRKLRQEGSEVIVNVGGEAAAHEQVWKKAINLNPVTAGRRTDIPNLVMEKGERIGEIFEPGSIDRVVSSKLPTSVDASQLGEGIGRVLRPGGKVQVNIFGTDVGGWSKAFKDALIKSGFKPDSVKVISDVLITATR